MMQGPNVKKLIAHKMALIAIPVGTPDGQGLATGINFLSSAKRVMVAAREATAFAEAAIDAVRNASDPNPWRQSSDEEIAGEILRLIDEQKKTKKK